MNSVDDPRDPNRTTYQSKALLFTRILSAILRYDSMRKMTKGFEDENTILNVAEILDDPQLKELPHWSTINNYLERLDPKELEVVIQKLVKHLINMDNFKSGRLRNRYWQVLIDGTRLFQIGEDDSNDCLFKVHRNKDGTIKSVEYYYYVVEAKLLFPNGIVISILTEFCENDEEVSPYEENKMSQQEKKQDCELKAFYRMVDRLKQLFGNTRICLALDSLYACEPVFKICEENNWRFITRFKEGSIPSIGKEFNTAAQEKAHRYHYFAIGGTQKYEFLTALNYKGHYLNVTRYTEDGKEYPFLFLTNLPINRKNCVDFVTDARNRWKVENQGFNIQKNHGYELTHKFSRDKQAIKNHYYLIQIAHAISQIFENKIDILEELNMALYEIHDRIKRDLMYARINIHSVESQYLID